MFANSRLYFVLGVVLLTSLICKSCDEEKDTYSNDSTSGDGVNEEPCTNNTPTEANGNINKFNRIAKRIREKVKTHGVFSSNSSLYKYRIETVSSCNADSEMYFIVSTSLASGTYMQANRKRYYGKNCYPDLVTTTKDSMLFGMSIPNNGTSSYKVAYICPDKLMKASAAQLLNCIHVRKYIINNSKAFKDLVEFLTADTSKSIELVNTPGEELCMIFKKSHLPGAGCGQFVNVSCTVSNSEN